MDVKIIKSNKRRKTIGARMVNEVMHIYAPAVLPQEKLEEIIENFKKRFEKRKLKKKLSSEKDLADIAKTLSQKYFGKELEINSIEYSANQDRLFGSCNHRTKTIYISHRLAEMPEWVRDYVIIHELAHIIEPNHGKSFWDLVSGYKLAERARGYLMAKGFEVTLSG